MKKVKWMSKRVARWLLLFNVATASAVQAGSAQNTTSGAGSQVTVSYYDITSQFNPVFNETVANSHLTVNTNATIVEVNHQGQLTEGLATEWRSSDDWRQFDFNIRSDARWSDGVLITPASVVQSFEYVRDLEADHNVILPLEGMQVSIIEDDPEYDNGIRFILAEPDRLFFHKMAHLGSSILPMHIAGVVDFSEPLEGSDWQRLPYAGPYIISGVTEGAITLTPNEHYYSRESIKNDGVTLEVGIDFAQGIYGRFLKGEIHAIQNRPSNLKEYIRKALGDQVRFSPRSSITYLVLNTEIEGLKNRDVRRALAMTALPSQNPLFQTSDSIVQENSPLPQALGSEFSRANPSWFDKPYAERVMIARKIMESHGYGPENPLELEISYNTSETHKRAMTMIRSQWNAIHVRANLVERSWKDHWRSVGREKDFSVARMGWNFDYVNPLNFLKTYVTGNKFNYGSYSNQTYDDVVDSARESHTDEQFSELSVVAQEILLEDAVIIPLYSYNELYINNPRLRGFTPVFNGIIKLKDLHLIEE